VATSVAGYAERTTEVVTTNSITGIAGPGAVGEEDDDDSNAEPKPRLEPLPVLEGYVPEGWKDAAK
jgi:hypothetical protein